MNPNPLAALNHFTCARAAPRRPRRQSSVARDRAHARSHVLGNSDTLVHARERAVLFRRARVSPARLAPSLARASLARARAWIRIHRPRAPRVNRRRRRRASRCRATNRRRCVFFGRAPCGGGPVDGFRWDSCMGTEIGVRAYVEAGLSRFNTLAPLVPPRRTVYGGPVPTRRTWGYFHYFLSHLDKLIT